MDTWKRAQSLSVVSRQEGAFLGKLEDFQFDLESRRITSWRIKSSGVFAKVGGLRVEVFGPIGRDVAFVESELEVHWGASKPASAPGRAWASTWKGTQAYSRRGQALGAVVDFVVEPGGELVTGLILAGGLLLHLDARVHTGPTVVIVESPDLITPLPGSEPAEEKAAWWGRLRDSLSSNKAEEKPSGDPSEGDE